MDISWKNVSYSRSFGASAEINWIYDIYFRANSLYGSDASILSAFFPTMTGCGPSVPEQVPEIQLFPEGGAEVEDEVEDEAGADNRTDAEANCNS